MMCVMWMKFIDVDVDDECDVQEVDDVDDECDVQEVDDVDDEYDVDDVE